MRILSLFFLACSLIFAQEIVDETNEVALRSALMAIERLKSYKDKPADISNSDLSTLFNAAFHQDIYKSSLKIIKDGGVFSDAEAQVQFIGFLMKGMAAVRKDRREHFLGFMPALYIVKLPGDSNLLIKDQALRTIRELGDENFIEAFSTTIGQKIDESQKKE